MKFFYLFWILLLTVLNLPSSAFGKTTASFCHRFIEYDCQFTRKYIVSNSYYTKPFPFGPDVIVIGGIKIRGLKEKDSSIEIRREQEKGVLADTRLVCEPTNKNEEQNACDSMALISDLLKKKYPKGQNQVCNDRFVTKNSFFKKLKDSTNASLSANNLHHFNFPNNWVKDHRTVRTYKTKDGGECACVDILTENLIFNLKGNFVINDEYSYDVPVKSWLPKQRGFLTRARTKNSLYDTGYLVLAKSELLGAQWDRLIRDESKIVFPVHKNFDIYPYNLAPPGFQWFMVAHDTDDVRLDYEFKVDEDDWARLDDDKRTEWKESSNKQIKRLREIKHKTCFDESKEPDKDPLIADKPKIKLMPLDIDPMIGKNIANAPAAAKPKDDEKDYDFKPCCCTSKYWVDIINGVNRDLLNPNNIDNYLWFCREGDRLVGCSTETVSFEKREEDQGKDYTCESTVVVNAFKKMNELSTKNEWNLVYSCGPPKADDPKKRIRFVTTRKKGTEIPPYCQDYMKQNP